jgi:hypothetical protein
MKKILILFAAIFLSIGAFGQTKTNSRIMLDSLNNKLNNGIIDHFALKDGNLVAIKANGDTLDYHITISGSQELSEVAFMLTDTAGQFTKYARKLSPTLTGTPAAPTAATGTNTTQIATTAFVQSATTNFSRLEFIVDTTVGAPVTTDSILTHTSLINKHIEVRRGTNGGTLYTQYRKNVGQLYQNGYSFQKATGRIVFTPHFETNEHIIIEASDSTKWTTLNLPYLDLLNDGNTLAWYDYSDATTLTMDADSVTEWRPLTGYGAAEFHMDQVVQDPVLTANGIVFNGNDAIGCAAFSAAKVQPISVYIVLTQDSWFDDKIIIALSTSNRVETVTSTPGIRITSQAGNSKRDDGCTVGDVHILRAFWRTNGVLGKIQVDAAAATTVQSGTSSMTLFSIGGLSGYTYSNVTIKEIIIRKTDDTGANETLIYNYLNTRY